MTVDVPLKHETVQEVSSCCRITEDGSQVCEVNTHQQEGSCGCQTQTVAVSEIRVSEIPRPDRKNTRWEDIRSAVMFAIACIASPCCTPLIVPAVVALLAGTPLALWIGENLGWVYGGLTLLSAVSFFFGLRWLNKNQTPSTRSFRS